MKKLFLTLLCSGLLLSFFGCSNPSGGGETMKDGIGNLVNAGASGDTSQF